MKQIALSKGQEAIVDDDCFENLNRFQWYADKNRNTWYAVRDQRLNGARFQLRMHSFIIGMPMSGFEIDHINGNGLDNRRENLNIVSRRENQSNRFTHRNGKLIGTSFDPRRNIWYSRIWIDGKQHYLGSYQTELQAADSYQWKLKELSLNIFE